MGVTYELFDSRRVKVDFFNPEITLRYGVFGESDYAAAIALVLAATPATYGNLVRQSFGLDPEGGGVWKAEIPYRMVERTLGADGGGAQDGENPPEEQPEPPSDDQVLGPEYSGTTSGATIHITQSIATRHAIQAIGIANPVDYKGAIGVTKDGVTGVDIIGHTDEWQVTYRFEYGMSPRYRRLLHELTGKINNAPFYGYQAGEVLFVGADWQVGQDRAASITYKFRCSKNVEGYDPAPGVLGVVPEKRGHDYAWFAYAPSVDNNTLVEQPVQVNIEQVYEEGDFSRLGIGA